MEKSNQLPKTEGCLAEGEPVGLWILPGRTTVEKRTQGKARAASGSRILLKQFSLERARCKRGRCLITGTQNRDARLGEGVEGLPGSKSVARAEGDARNRGGPELSRRTNCASQAGMSFQRRGEAAEAVRGVGSARSRSWQGIGPEVAEGADSLTKSTQATSSVRSTESNWQTFLRAIDSVSG